MRATHAIKNVPGAPRPRRTASTTMCSSSQLKDTAFRFTSQGIHNWVSRRKVKFLEKYSSQKFFMIIDYLEMIIEEI